MRNLKKILALVLALVMSLSLMATAGATDFQDAEDISEAYETAIEVLNGLEVFKGYDNGATFKPQGNITRAEVAAIIYRIATGDVTDAQKDIYSSWGLFTDVVDGSWYAGYVNYCANAGYIKGRGNKIFDPNGNVTGYEALAMILRAIGYDKNNEFSGTNWQVRTASIAKQRHITDNITDTLLGQAATREVVAEILFQSILVNEVEFQTSTLSYTEKNITLGKEVLDLDEVTGVVVANEYANLQDDAAKVLAEGKTQMRVAAGDVRTLDLGTELTDLGESRFAYIQGSKVLAIADSGENTVFDNTNEDAAKNGKNVDFGATFGSFTSVTGLTKTNDTEFFTNFDHTTEKHADRRIEFRVTFKNQAAEDAFCGWGNKVDISKVAVSHGFTVETVNTNGSRIALLSAANVEDYKDAAGYAYSANNTNQYIRYTHVFRLDDILTSDDLNVIRGIFGLADDEDATSNIIGSVFVGSTSSDTTNYNTDVSDTMSYDAFVAAYIVDKNNIAWTAANDGEWVKVIDNNGDGKADYALKTTFAMDKVVDTVKNSSGTEFNRFYGLDLANNTSKFTARYLNDVAVGDIVLYIDSSKDDQVDGQALIWKADVVTDKITNITDMYARAINMTTASGETYYQSEIINETRLDQLIRLMSKNVSYNVYLDAFGRVRAYEPVSGSKYALVTELYYGQTNNGRYYYNDVLTAEVKAGDSAIVERTVSNRLNNSFLLNIADRANGAANNWAVLDATLGNGSNLYVSTVQNRNNNQYTTADYATRVILQPAVGSLGFRSNLSSRDIFTGATTNVARYVDNGDGTASLSTAVQQAYTNAGVLQTGNWQFAVNYVRLGNTSVAKGANTFTLVNNDGTANVPATSGYNTGVVANNNTEFYIVGNNGVQYVKGFANLPAVTGIRSMYAVAHDSQTTDSTTKQHYWVAEVVVIESTTYEAAPDDYLWVLGMANAWAGTMSAQSVNDGQSVLAVSAVDKQVVRIAPSNFNWTTNSIVPGFYKAYGMVKQEDGSWTASDIRRVDASEINVPGSNSANTNAFSLKAGTVISEKQTDGRYGVNTGTINNHVIQSQLELAGPVVGMRQAANGAITTTTRYDGDNATNLLAKGNNIIWVANSSGQALFVVDVTYCSGSAWKGVGSVYEKLLADYNTVLVKQNQVQVSNVQLTELWLKGQKVTLDQATKTGTLTLTGGQAASTSAKNYAYTIIGDASASASLSVYETRADVNNPYQVAWDATDWKVGDTVTATKKVPVTVQINTAGGIVTYIVNVTVNVASTDAALASLSIKGVPVSITADKQPAVGDSGTYALTADISAIQNNGDALRVDARARNANAKVEVLQSGTDAFSVTESQILASASGTGALTVGAGKTIAIKVTAEDGITTATYNVTVGVAGFNTSVVVTSNAMGAGNNVYAKVNGSAIAGGSVTLTGMPTGSYQVTIDTDPGYYLAADAIAINNVKQSTAVGKTVVLNVNVVDGVATTIAVTQSACVGVVNSGGVVTSFGANVSGGFAIPGSEIVFYTSNMPTVKATFSNGTGEQVLTGTQVGTNGTNYEFRVTAPTTGTITIAANA